MLADNWVTEILDVLLMIFAVYLFFFYFDIFFQKKKEKICVLVGTFAVVAWQLDIAFVAIWMLMEILIGDLFMIYHIDINELQALDLLLQRYSFFL